MNTLEREWHIHVLSENFTKQIAPSQEISVVEKFGKQR